MSTEVAPHANGANAGPSRKGWAARFPVYQIDFTAVASGKRIATTKRRVRWRFGFSNKEALENGETGTSCRGEEHDVTIVWSITSGKRLILADGQEVHYSNSRSSVLEYSWTMRGNHVLKLVAHAAPPMNAVPGFRQYDLHVDGQSFFQMPKVYELGIKGPSHHHGRVPGVHPQSGQRPADGRQYDQSRGRYVSDQAAADAPRTRQEEEADLQRAISASIEESRKHLQTATPSHRSDGVQDAKPSVTAPAPAPQLAAAPPQPVPTPAPPQPVPTPAPPETDLLGFTAAAPPAQIVMPAAAPPATSAPSNALVHVGPAPVDAGGPFAAVPVAPVQQGSFTSGPSNPYLPPVDQIGQQPPPMPANTFSTQPVASGAQPAVVDPFAPQSTVADDPFAPKPPPPPTYSDISSDILRAYSGDQQSSSQAPGETSLSLPAQPGPADYNTQGFSEQVPQGNAPENAAAVSTALVTSEPESEPKSEVDQAMKKLINFEDISSPAEPETKLTMNPYEDDETKAKKRLSSIKSVPIAPPAAGWGGAQPTLGQMKSARPPPKAGSIMQQPANVHSAAGAGALVLHGSQTNGGVPPIRRVSGFGVGASMPQGGYAHSSGPELPHNQGYDAPPQMHQQQPHPTQQRYNNY